ncbi:hypothetical protein EW145_g4288 [Phellinidium pouzarii]|uniref:Fe2OG dioxygenase domain-containing protein n=1 Tax=Phellinidium pouzarii TaxID=167371 RepID=A0A4V3XCK4_9AGAM|nr:hypothetical protein EW145_g4288 [Phellinidium pouzarii]
MTVETVLQAASLADYGFKNIPVMKQLALILQSGNSSLGKSGMLVSMSDSSMAFKNHGIPEETILGAIEEGKKFFALPTETKFEYDSRKSPNFKGYGGLLSGNNDPENRGDLHEGFDIGPENSHSSKKSAMSGANVWPTAVAPNFRERVLSYYDAAVSFGRTLFPLFAIALDLPEDFFDDKTQETAAIMRVLHYPPQTGPHDDRVLGIGAHTDFECFTILWQEPNIDALQVLNAKNEWVKATPIPGTLVINIGDQLARWTNDVFKSTVHRAINRTGVERYSMPLFFGVDYNVELKAIPSCISAERPPKYEVITAGEHVKARLEVTYGK